MFSNIHNKTHPDLHNPPLPTHTTRIKESMCKTIFPFVVPGLLCILWEWFLSSFFSFLHWFFFPFWPEFILNGTTNGKKLSNIFELLHSLLGKSQVVFIFFVNQYSTNGREGLDQGFSLTWGRLQRYYNNNEIVCVSVCPNLYPPDRISNQSSIYNIRIAHKAAMKLKVCLKWQFQSA